MSDEHEEELALEPIDPETELARQAIMETQPPCMPESTEASPPKIQFGIFHVLVVTTVVAGFASLTQWFSDQAILTAIGLFAFFSLLLIRVSESPHPLIRFAWWCLFAVYLGFVVVIAVSAG